MIPFDPQATSFSLTNAHALARVSDLVYQTGFDVEYDSKHYWNMEYAYLENATSDTQFLVMGDAEKVFVAFRGTEGKLEDWTTNAQYDLKEALGGRVHEGFWKAAESVLGDVAQTIDRFCQNGQTVWLTGHSLGGALAVLTAAYFVEQGAQPAGVYTFGQPRVGDIAFTTRLQGQYNRLYRVVCEGDLVASLPPKRLGYAHAGEFYRLLKAGGYDQNLTAWEQQWASDAAVLDSFAELVLFGLEEHRIITYAQHIEATLSQ